MISKKVGRNLYVFRDIETKADSKLKRNNRRCHIFQYLEKIAEKILCESYGNIVKILKIVWAWGIWGGIDNYIPYTILDLHI